MSVGDSVVMLRRQAVPDAERHSVRVAERSACSDCQGHRPKLPAEDGGQTPLFIQQIYKNRDDPIPMVIGLDARLIEAEAKLYTMTFAGMMTILNALRTAPPKIGNFQPAMMAAIATTPATKDDATSLFFREKALWQFARGQRLSDLRRLVRQYGRTQDKVYPRGQQYKGVALRNRHGAAGARRRARQPAVHRLHRQESVEIFVKRDSPRRRAPRAVALLAL